MIRPFTCVSMLLACASGLYLYQTKHRAQLLDREIAHTMQLAEAARARTGVLRAEWALLNEPSRLSELADRYLTLKTLAPTQFVALDQLGQRVPVVAPEPAAVEAPKLLSEAPPPQPGTPEPARPEPSLPAIIPTAEAAPVPPESGVATRAQRRPERRTSAGTAYASTSDATAGFVGEAPRATILQQSLPPPSAPSVTPAPRPGPPPSAPKRQNAAVARPVAPKITTVTYPARLVASAASPAPTPAPFAPGGSLLGGMRAALPPPVPFGHGQTPP